MTDLPIDAEVVSLNDRRKRRDDTRLALEPLKTKSKSVIVTECGLNLQLHVDFVHWTAPERDKLRITCASGRPMDGLHVTRQQLDAIIQAAYLIMLRTDVT